MTAVYLGGRPIIPQKIERFSGDRLAGEKLMAKHNGIDDILVEPSSKLYYMMISAKKLPIKSAQVGMYVKVGNVEGMVKWVDDQVNTAGEGALWALKNVGIVAAGISAGIAVISGAILLIRPFSGLGAAYQGALAIGGLAVVTALSTGIGALVGAFRKPAGVELQGPGAESPSEGKPSGLVAVDAAK